MKRTYNYTGRVRIDRKHVSVKLSEVLQEGPSLEVRTELSGYSFQFDSIALLEAQSDTSWQRCELNDVLATNPVVQQVVLSEFVDTDGVRFKIKVVDTSTDARILGVAEDIRLIDPADVVGDPEGLLLVRWADIGQRIWKLDFEPNGKPELLLSKRLRGQERQLATDPMFRACVLPEVLRQVLEKVTTEDEDADEIEDSWVGEWIGWMNSVQALSKHIDPLLNNDEEKRLSTIDEAVSDFADLRENSFVDKLIANVNWESG